MLHQRPSDRLHKIAAQETEIRLRILLLQRSHQVGGMQITGGFARYQKIFHIYSIDN